MSKPTTLLKWPGGKSRLVPAILEALGEKCEGTYREPFVGSASVFLGLSEAGAIGRAVISDINPRLISFLQVVRDQVGPFLSDLVSFPTGEGWRDFYYPERSLLNEPWTVNTDPVIQAARFAWLNRACFNGLYRESKTGRFNTPIGSYKTVSIPEPGVYRRASEFLQKTEIRASGFALELEQAGAGDWVYCDPPYVPASATANFTAYSADGFSMADQEALAGLAIRAARRGARVVISNADVPLCRERLYPERIGWKLQSISVQRSISAGKERAKAGEILATLGPL